MTLVLRKLPQDDLTPCILTLIFLLPLSLLGISPYFSNFFAIYRVFLGVL